MEDPLQTSRVLQNNSTNNHIFANSPKTGIATSPHKELSLIICKKQISWCASRPCMSCNGKPTTSFQVPSWSNHIFKRFCNVKKQVEGSWNASLNLIMFYRSNKRTGVWCSHISHKYKSTITPTLSWKLMQEVRHQ
jgi:hypothetical protein